EAVRHRRGDAERAGPDRGPLEHHGHLFAGQEGASRQHSRRGARGLSFPSNADTRTRTMKHDYSLAHLTVLSLAPPQVIDVAARPGYRYVGLRMTRVTPDEVLYDLARDRALMRETKVRLADTGVAVLDTELFRMDPTLGPDAFVAELDATAELGAHHIIAQLPDPDRERATGRFARLCDLAKARDIFVSLEFPHWTETGTLAEA